jgi:hypothetical protein
MTLIEYWLSISKYPELLRKWQMRQNLTLWLERYMGYRIVSGVTVSEKVFVCLKAETVLYLQTNQPLYHLIISLN